MQWYVRSDSIQALQPLKARVLACLEAGALATGCTCTSAWEDRPYAEMVDSVPMLAAYAANSARIGREIREPDGSSRVVGSTDMGNVSYLVPYIHPMIKVAPDGVPIHTPDFAETPSPRPRPGRPRRRQGDGHDRRRPVGRRGLLGRRPAERGRHRRTARPI
jgi:metal-dependent amidase/aminoacylase/carboxypeptidase family protein